MISWNWSKIEMIGLQPLERLVDLPCGGILVAAVDFRHQKDLVAVSVAEALPMRISLCPLL